MRTQNKKLIRPRMLRRALMTATLAVSVSGGIPGASAAECREIAEALQAALAKGRLEAARGHYDTLWHEPGCEDTMRFRAGRAVSALHARVAQERMAAGESLESQRPVLERGLAYARTWPLLALLGDAAHDEADYGGASALYQEALAVIDDAAMTPNAPPEPEIERIFRRAAQSRMLAADYRPVPRSRSGAPSGLAAVSIRGFVIKRVPLPISFHTDSTEFTAQGRHAAADMAEYLEDQAPQSITIVGHTDPSGPKAYNLELSRQRAEAVAWYLLDQGFEGRIDIVAKGETERFPIDDPSAYTKEERWQMDRRVELIR